MSESKNNRFLIPSAMYKFKMPILLALTVLISGCNLSFNYWYSNSVKVSDEDEKLVMSIYKHLHAREFEQVVNLSVDGLSLDYLRLNEPRFIAWFPEEPISHINIVSGSEVFVNGVDKKLVVGLQARHKKTFVHFEAVLNLSENNHKLESFQIQNGVERLDVNNSTSWSDAKAIHYIVVSLMILVPIFIIYTLYHCWHLMRGGRRVFWMFFILFGLPKFILNWGSGNFELIFLSINILGISVQGADYYMPLRLGVALPLGAIMYWMFKDQANIK
jgi:hypothetical protein